MSGTVPDRLRAPMLPAPSVRTEGGGAFTYLVNVPPRRP